MDIDLPKLHDIKATRRILQDRSAITILDLSIHHELQVQSSMRETGVEGYVTKESIVEHRYAAIAKAIAEKLANHSPAYN